MIYYMVGSSTNLPFANFVPWQVRYLNDVSILDTLLETEKKALAKVQMGEIFGVIMYGLIHDVYTYEYHV